MIIRSNAIVAFAVVALVAAGVLADMSTPTEADDCAKAAEIVAQPGPQAGVVVAMTCSGGYYTVLDTGSAVKIGPRRWVTARHVVTPKEIPLAFDASLQASVPENGKYLFLVDSAGKAHRITHLHGSTDYDIVAFNSSGAGIERRIVQPTAGESLTAWGQSENARMPLVARTIIADPRKVWSGSYLLGQRLGHERQ